MDNSLVATLLGVGVQTVSTIIQSYVTFKRTNVEKYFEMLLNERQDISSIGNDERLQMVFYRILENVANETTNEKITNWKNLTIRLATELKEVDFAENYTSMLNELTPFDLTVLYAIYSVNFTSTYFEKELIKYFEERHIEDFKLIHSLKRLSNNNLVEEEANGATYLGNDETETFGQKFVYKKSRLGQEFLRIISNTGTEEKTTANTVCTR